MQCRGDWWANGSTGGIPAVSQSTTIIQVPEKVQFQSTEMLQTTGPD
eukprot:CAMPEP_0174299718 /NCGR_PEP_ID=MMETSP0809-20121228/57421_1 /TAXON_ID=73025 ORGANISM="Eutreptiella gymnastica-like, Strain CCMP1594" /NCGR_SAMPLE_ID=MMETSP0809 /ASSEMBLY_ACC=CAM_ASM_000658 /LENGTH=46 /DNA_ID= /DNA_START= /DNA_END= /DNA_ORIENTATION=